MLPEPHGRKVDYGLLQEESKRVGDRGEEFVFNFEKAALEREGRADLAADVLWVARDIGDGAGYDIRSFSLDGLPRYIEVKATKLGALTPFYITSAELDFARRHQEDYAIYRVFDIDGEAPEFYVLEGDLDTLLAVEPVTYRARPALNNLRNAADRRSSASSKAMIGFRRNQQSFGMIFMGLVWGLLGVGGGGAEVAAAGEGVERGQGRGVHAVVVLHLPDALQVCLPRAQRQERDQPGGGGPRPGRRRGRGRRRRLHRLQSMHGEGVRVLPSFGRLRRVLALAVSPLATS
jgi:hypothetical protein